MRSFSCIKLVHGVGGGEGGEGGVEGRGVLKSALNFEYPAKKKI